MKYIVFTDRHNESIPVLFPSALRHSDVADAIANGDYMEKHGLVPVSAGYVRQTTTGVKCWGEAASMRMRSIPHTDERIIKVNMVLDIPHT